MTQAISGVPASRPAGILRRGRLLVSAAAIALAGIAAPGGPARSQSADEILAFILGAAAVAVIVRSFEQDARPRHRLGAGRLPDACLETVRLNRRHIDLYHAGCLGWYGFDRLPRRCETRIRTNVGVRRYFLAQCLYEANYRPERGWVSGPPFWDAPWVAPRPRALPPVTTPHHRERDERGWRQGRSGRDHDRGGRGWDGHNRDDRNRWRDGSRRSEERRSRSRDRRGEESSDWSPRGPGSNVDIWNVGP